MRATLAATLILKVLVTVWCAIALPAAAETAIEHEARAGIAKHDGIAAQGPEFADAVMLSEAGACAAIYEYPHYVDHVQVSWALLDVSDFFAIYWQDVARASVPHTTYLLSLGDGRELTRAVMVIEVMCNIRRHQLLAHVQ